MNERVRMRVYKIVDRLHRLISEDSRKFIHAKHRATVLEPAHTFLPSCLFNFQFKFHTKKTNFGLSFKKHAGF